MPRSSEVMRSDQGRTRASNYVAMLTEFWATNKTSKELIAYLESLGFSHGQARNAVYRFRQRLKQS